MNCPVRQQCAEHALRVHEPYGVWGGLTEDDREEYYAREKAARRADTARRRPKERPGSRRPRTYISN